MDESHARQFFFEPKQTFQRQYEALRAIFRRPGDGNLPRTELSCPSE